MSSEVPDPHDIDATNVENVRVEDEMEQSYIDYAMSVIAGRALPDVRDGLKPVHRRILYAMHEMGVTSSAGHRKSSSVVGEVMGDYHPHGDTAIYDTLVKMAQEFSMRQPLIDGQGNFGSRDGDPPAAMRYTEARMSPIAEEMLADIEKETVDFSPNYDDRLEEPAVLPSAFPNLLVNGSTGIAVGMSTKIPPHNLGEVIDATVHVIENPDCDLEELVDTRGLRGVPENDGPIKGPDFPTGASIVGKRGLYEAYATGRGKVRMRTDYEIEHGDGRDRIVVSELPYQQNKARLVERIADDVNEGTLDGIADLRDESDRNGVRIVIEIKPGANTELVENRLLEHHFERTFGVINLALVDGKPEILTLKETIEAYVDHRRTVVRRRSQHDLDEAKHRAHILEGRLRALENVEDVVELIRNSSDRDAAKSGLQETFGFTEAQAAHIVRMQLGSLTSMERSEIEDEYEDVTAEIDRLEEILDSDELLDQVIIDELREIQSEYAEERQTAIVEDHGTVTREDLIPEENVLVVVTEDDYVKRMPIGEFRTQRRGGKGIIGADPKESDRVSAVFRANTHDYCLCFTNYGQVYRLKTYELPQFGRTARGSNAVNVIDLDEGEEITAVVTTDELESDECITMVTRKGYIKRTAATEFENIFSTGIIAVKLDEDDNLVDVEVTRSDDDLIVATKDGMSIRFPVDDVREMGRSARGVKAIDLRQDDEVVGLVATTDADRDLLTVTADGHGKRTPLEEYRTQSRYGKGLVDIRIADRNDAVTAIRAVEPDDHLVVMSERGQILRTRVAEISKQGRNTQGVIVMRLTENDRVACIEVLPEDDSQSAEGSGENPPADPETDC